MAEIITFRPTPEVQEILSRAKEEGANISKYINNLITSSFSGDGSAHCTQFLFYAEGLKDEMPESYIKIPVEQAVAAYSVPVGCLCMRRYKEFREVIQSNGMQQHFFKIDADNSFCIISTSREEASAEFGKYFIRDPKTKEYSRTMLPLPQIRYDIKNRIVIIVRKEPKL